jgi:hypothetical protein
VPITAEMASAWLADRRPSAGLRGRCLGTRKRGDPAAFHGGLRRSDLMTPMRSRCTWCWTKPRTLAAQGERMIPVAKVEKALRLTRALPEIDAALLDLNLRGAMAFPLRMFCWHDRSLSSSPRPTAGRPFLSAMPMSAGSGSRLRSADCRCAAQLSGDHH